ncbi:GNAT family N-acetyltransferase [Streptomyces mirabilis]|uniref:GNAT family N-acetyltransferase n=1 Tax=Streptomyces mirabilis TaxID=68239 RepID=UPI003660BB0C
MATELVSRVLDEIRESGKKITSICPVVGEFIDRNLEYADLIDKVHPGAGAYPKHKPGEGGHDEELTATEDDLAQLSGVQTWLAVSASEARDVSTPARPGR